MPKIKQGYEQGVNFAVSPWQAKKGRLLSGALAPDAPYTVVSVPFSLQQPDVAVSVLANTVPEQEIRTAPACVQHLQTTAPPSQPQQQPLQPVSIPGSTAAWTTKKRKSVSAAQQPALSLEPVHMPEEDAEQQEPDAELTSSSNLGASCSIAGTCYLAWFPDGRLSGDRPMHHGKLVTL